MKKFQIKYLADYIVNKLVEKYSLDNNNFSELVRLEVEVKARLALVPGEITFSELVNAIIDQVQVNTVITTN